MTDANAAGDAPTVTVAVLTFRRPADLSAGLPMLLAQAAEVNAASLGQRTVDVLVVDNDPEGTARAVAQRHESDMLRYVVEVEAGIAAARNRALDEAAGTDLMIFIDDDERPCASWLRALLDAQADSGAAGVAGAVVSRFEQPLDPWIAAGGFFERPRVRTGTSVQAAATNNLLLDLRQIRRLGLRFDPAFGLTGGEDTLFTRSLIGRGGRIVWCDEAVVTDEVPVDRATRRWVLLRGVSSGNTAARVEYALAGGSGFGSPTGLRVGVGGLLRVAAGGLRWLLGMVLRSLRHRAGGLRTASRGVGMALGAAGYVYREYDRGRLPPLELVSHEDDQHEDDQPAELVRGGAGAR